MNEKLRFVLFLESLKLNFTDKQQSDKMLTVISNTIVSF